MKKKPKKARWKPTLVECELVEITDPAEQAELDRRFRAAEKALEELEAPKKPKPRKRK